MSNIERLHEIINDGAWVHKGTPIPSIIEVSLTDHCNLSCKFCPHRNPSYPNNRVFATDELIERLCEQLKVIRFGGLVTFSGYGEPLFHEGIARYVEKVSKVCKVDVVTNGTLLNERKLSKLLLSGVNKVLVSAYSPKVYKDMERLFRDVFPHKYEVRNRFAAGSDFEISNRGGSLGGFGNRNPCWYTSYCLTLDYNGDVMLCPHDFNRNVRFGNLMGQSLMEIWDGAEMNKHRMKLVDCRKGLVPCGRCNVDGTVLGEENMELWKNCKSITQSSTMINL